MAVQTRCPKCGAALRPDAPWCTLCYADLRPPPVTEVTDVTAAAPLEPDPLSAPLRVVAPEVGAPAPVVAAGPGWPCSACGATNAVERDTCAGCGLPFLSALREGQPPLLELPLVGDITRLSRAQRFGLAGGVVLAFVLLTLVVGLLLG